ncbi:hypothetical protein XpiCFBP4643_14565 [Xanthomonas pisi]|uniref:Uncharacterized protein n=1 Tax=Xanthomonas pisi TaxID=56457 RepID=A0A2S7D1M4_9XANT|nr:hypothetical protein XpiCFBP4643_14565 [Xanthomonas pisi]
MSKAELALLCLALPCFALLCLALLCFALLCFALLTLFGAPYRSGKAGRYNPQGGAHGCATFL